MKRNDQSDKFYTLAEKLKLVCTNIYIPARRSESSWHGGQKSEIYDKPSPAAEVPPEFLREFCGVINTDAGTLLAAQQQPVGWPPTLSLLTLPSRLSRPLSTLGSF